jgi:hypothetical protein
MRKGKDPDPGGPKHVNPADPDPTPDIQYCYGTSGSQDEGEGPEEAGIDGRGEEGGGDGHSHQAASVTTQHRQSHT